MKVQITSNPKGAIVRNSNFDKIGETPCAIDSDIYRNQKIYLNYKGDIIDILIDSNNPSIFYDFQAQNSETHKTEIDPVEKQKHDTESIISTNTSKNKFPTLIVIIVGILVCIGFGYAYLNSSPKVINENKLEKAEFLELSDEDKIKHYLKYEDLRDTNYIKSLYDLNNLHYWQVDNGVTTFRWTQKLSLHAVSLENEKE